MPVCFSIVTEIIINPTGQAAPNTSMLNYGIHMNQVVTKVQIPNLLRK